MCSCKAKKSVVITKKYSNTLNKDASVHNLSVILVDCYGTQSCIEIWITVLVTHFLLDQDLQLCTVRVTTPFF